MTIQTSVPASNRVPGTFFEFNIANAARGLVSLIQRIALVGVQSAAATKTAVEVNEVFAESEGDLFYGQGSELALMVKFAFRGSRDIGVAVQVHAIGIADPAGTAALHTFTVTGSPTEVGEVKLRIAGRVIRAAVGIGDSVTVIALSIVDAISEQLPELPITVGSAIGVVTTTAVVLNENGSDVVHEVDDVPAGVTVVAANSVPGVGVSDITLSLDVLADKDYDFVAIANHKAADITDFTTHLDAMFAAGVKRWRFGLMTDTTSLATGQALATAADDFRQVVVEAEDFRNTPGEISAYLAGILGGAADPALPWNNVELPTLFLPDPANVPTAAELNSGINGGLFMLSVNENQSRAKIVRAVTTQVSLSSAPFFALLDLTIPRTMHFAARQVDIQLLLQFARAKKNDATIRRVRSVVLSTLKLLEAQEQLQNVSARANELIVETDSTNPDRLNVAIPTSVVPPLNQIVNVINLIVE